MTDSDPPRLKDFVDAALVEAIGNRFAAVVAGFDRDGFVTEATATLEQLELKDRIALVATALAGRLPGAFPEASRVVVAATGCGEAPSGWEAWPLATFIELYGSEHPEAALDAMETVTRFASCEFAIRPLLEKHPEETFDRLRRWITHEDEAVRRLVSEGTRPLLPWGRRVAALREDPRRGMELAGVLRSDPSEGVRRSVANHLNDVSKDHPEIALETAARWASEGLAEVYDVVAHGLRTLIKRGNPSAMEILGFTAEAEIDVDEFSCEPAEIEIGGRVELRATLRSIGNVDQRVVVDYAVNYVKADGRTSAKVFKWATMEIGAGETRSLKRRQWFRDLSTRTHHPGTHTIVLQVAGRAAATVELELTH
jgi:3-methyladenine DNA glycosylase AlkC